ncbi:MAG: hypothetical protein GY798_14555 [Hyphomicrobiales bacterium]|nr:hypothetical protein [Hyphomicrobiales bacterium]
MKDDAEKKTGVETDPSDSKAEARREFLSKTAAAATTTPAVMLLLSAGSRKASALVVSPME